MKFKRSAAFAVVISSLIANSFGVYAEETEYSAIPVISEESAETDSEIETAEYIMPDTDEISAYAFDGGDGSAENPYQISTPEQFNEIRNNLSACYILTSDIDLSGIENYESIGSFVPMGESGEDAETPSPDYAFSGSLDGAGHTISGLKINSPEGFAVGLFGCVNGSEIKNLNITGADVSASMMCGGVVGYLFDGTIQNVSVSDSVVNGTVGSMGTDMIGGIAGAGMDSKMLDCNAENVTVNLADNGGNTGIAAGGFEVCTISNVSVTGVINAGDNCSGLGGIAGCNFGGDKVENCNADVSINAGENAYLVGGITGYAGGFDSDTEVNDCDANVNITLSAGAERVGGIIGGGFFNSAYTEYYPNPSSFKVSGCTSGGSIIGANIKNAGTIAGYTLLSEVSEDNSSTLKINGADAALIGDSKNYEVLNALQGTYQQFFTNGVFNAKYDSIWHNYCAAVVGESAADETVAAMKYSIGGKLYGEDAVNAYSKAPETTQFFCDFTNDVSTLTIDGSNISGKDKNGNTLFSHTYYYVDTVDANDYPGFTFDVFATNEDAGEFKYFAFAPDTPDTTYHIEFRYCGEYEDLVNLMSGKYAYWLAAGIRDVDIASDIVTEKVIALFCTENMQYSTKRSADSLAQLKDLTGKWNCDMTAFKALPEYADADMYMVISADGTGKSFVDMTGGGNYVEASDFLAYAYNTSNNAKEGIYIAYTDDEGAEYSKYMITETDTRLILDFYTVDGIKLVSYYKEKSKEETSEETTESTTETTAHKSGGSSSGGSSSRGGRSSDKASAVSEKAEETSAKSDISDPESTSNNADKAENKDIVLKIDSTSAVVFGESKTLYRAPVIINGRTMLPVRFIAENLGYEVNWEQDEHKASISLDGVLIELYENSDTAYINGESVKIDSPAFNDNGALFVPARFIFEAFNADVAWNGTERTVTITVG